MKAIFAVSIAFALVGCAAKRKADDVPPAIASPESKMEIPVTLKPVEMKTAPKAWSGPGTTVTWEDRSFRVYEAHAKLKDVDPETQRMYGFGIVIEIRDGKRKRYLDLREQTGREILAHVFHDPINRRLWALTEWGVAGPGRIYSTWITEDGGETWFRGGDIRRPGDRHPPASLVTLWIDGKGRGEALFSLETDFASDESNLEKNMKLGAEVHYRAITKDGGRSWFTDPQIVRWNGMKQAK